jgi:tetratricopeptide (TPR) repeat protein
VKAAAADTGKATGGFLPWQLPPDVRGFTGRAEQIARLDALLTAREQFSAPTVALVSGTPGVGKTALVVHWAHKARGHFPDGLLYVDLRGFDPEQPRDPAEVLDGFLRGLGVPRDEVPGDLAERTALFRARVDRRKILVFLDNAATDEQVRPLLPNSPQSLVVVTSRTSLNGLIARDGAHHIRLPHLPVEDAVSLLQVLIGDNRVDEDQAGATDLVERCARLPLAIRIGAELASTRRRSGLTELARELRRYHLDLFSAGGDERTAIRTVFSWSYLHLRADRARAFRLLGLHPGHDLDPHTGAALMDIDLPTARMRIDDLVRANLIEEAGNDRYRMHDLLRAYAREEADRHDPDEAVQAMHRLFDHYLGTSATAMALLAPHDAMTRTAIPVPPTVLPLENVEQALDWLDAERRNLLTMAEIAANGTRPGYATQVSALLFRYLYTRAHYHDAMALHSLALKVTRNHGVSEIEGWELARIGVVHLRLGHLVEAQDHLASALDLAREADDALLETRVFRHLGQVSLQLARYEEALDLLAGALPAARALPDRHTEGHLLSAMGVACGGMGRNEEAMACHYEALVVAEELGDHELLGAVLNNLGRHHVEIDTDKAEMCHRRALAIAREAGNPGLETESLLELGTVLARTGRTAAARTALSRALVLAAGIGEHHVEKKVRDVLDALPSD